MKSSVSTDGVTKLTKSTSTLNASTLATSSSSSKHRPSQNDSGKRLCIKYAKALYDYTAQNIDEISFEEDDIIGVISTETTLGWLYGECNNTFGFFPESYVSILSAEQAEAEELGISFMGEPIDTPKSWISKLFHKPSVSKKTPATQDDNSEETVEEAESASTSLSKTSPLSQASKLLRRPSFNSVRNSEVKQASTPSLTAPKEEHEHANFEVPLAEKRSRRLSISANLFSNMKSKDELKSTPVLSTPTASPAPPKTMVSIVGAPAAVKERWMDIMGGADQVAQMNLSKKEIQRQEVIYEVWTTEKDFCEDLTIIIEVCSPLTAAVH